MPGTIVAVAASAVTMLVLDGIWLSLMASRLYKPELGGLLRDKFLPAPAVLFYIIYLGGIAILAVWPAIAAGRWTVALGRGAVLGFVAYATYDLTNLATLRGWSLPVTLADLAWGTILTALAAAAEAAAGLWWSSRL